MRCGEARHCAADARLVRVRVRVRVSDLGAYERHGRVENVTRHGTAG